MSYTLTPFLVDLGKLKAAVKSKDKALLQAVYAGNPDALSADAEPEEDDEDEDLSLRTALQHLVMGEPFADDSAHQYGYALMELCGHLGARLPADQWSGVRWEVLEQTGADELVTKTGTPVELPETDDFPRIGFLDARKVAATVEKMGSGKVTNIAPSGRAPRRSLLTRLFRLIMPRESLSAADKRGLFGEYEEWLRRAAKEKKGLVFFYY